MARPRTPIGTFGAVSTDTAPNGTVIARTHYRDEDGPLRKVQASSPNAKAAERNLKIKIAHRTTRFTDTSVLTADSSFGKLVELWPEDFDLEGRIAPSTRGGSGRLWRGGIEATVTTPRGRTASEPPRLVVVIGLLRRELARKGSQMVAACRN